MNAIRTESRRGVALVVICVSMLAVGVLGAALLAASSAARQERLYFDIGNRAQYAAESGRSYAYSRRDSNIHYVPLGSFALGSGDQFALNSVLQGSNLVVTSTGAAHPGTYREAQRAVHFVLTYNPVVVIDDVFLWAQQLSARGVGLVDGPGGVVVISGDINASEVRGGMDIQVTTIFIDGDALMNAAGTANLGSSTVPGNTYISGDLEMLGAAPTLYGDVHVGGNLILGAGEINGNIYVHGNVEIRDFGFALIGDSSIYYAGTLTPPDSLPGQIIQVAEASLPPLLMVDAFTPHLRDPRPQWYTDRGYVAGAETMEDGLKVYTDADFIGSTADSLLDVVIVSDGDIDLTVTGNNTFVGVLVAPNGSVTFKGKSFEGLVIAGAGFYVETGSPDVTFRSISEFFDGPDDYPVTLDEEF